MAIRSEAQQRQLLIISVFLLASVVLVARAVQLQLLDASYGNRAAAITIERDVLYPSRGVIYDRNGQLMVYNNAMYDLLVTYKQVDFLKDTAKIQRFCHLIGVDTAYFFNNVNKDWSTGKFNKAVEFPFMTMIPPEQYARFQESLSEFAGFKVQLRNVRGYPQHNAGHLLGYLSEVNDKHIKDSLGLYEAGDFIGASGLEKYYEPFLRGKKGIRFQLKDNLGRNVGQYKEGVLDTPAVQGKDLISAIDLKLQALGERLMKNKIGAIVAIEPKSGEILAMVTSPTFDPENMIMSKKRSEFFSRMYKDSLKPMFDRTVTAEYPPGSVFKPMVGLIGLQMGVWDKNRGVVCNGGYHNGNRIIKCHGPSPGNMSQAIAHSCNAYFCTVYKTIVDRFGYRNPQQGLDSFNAYASRFGMGAPLLVDFPAERKGFLPTSKFYNKVNKRDGFWYSSYIVSNGIGQGENQLTTMQMANLAAIIANRGWFYTPHLIRGFRDIYGNNVIGPLHPRFLEKHHTGVDVSHFEYVIRGMRAVIESGTGSNARIDGVAVCGKTGTSQNPHGQDSSVFIGFAPEENPQIAIAVYVENGGWGNDFAAPITGLMIEQYLKKELPATRLSLVERMEKSHLAYSSRKGYYVQKAW